MQSLLIIIEILFIRATLSHEVLHSGNIIIEEHIFVPVDIIFANLVLRIQQHVLLNKIVIPIVTIIGLILSLIVVIFHHHLIGEVEI